MPSDWLVVAWLMGNVTVVEGSRLGRTSGGDEDLDADEHGEGHGHGRDGAAQQQSRGGAQGEGEGGVAERDDVA